MLKSFLILFLMSFQLVALADLYKSVKNSHVIEFSNSFKKNSQAIQIRAINYSHAQKPVSDKKYTGKIIDENKYQAFNIDFPKNNQSFYNQRRLKIQYTIKPALKPGDKVKLRIDNKEYEGEKNNEFLLENLNRGEHFIQAEVVNATGKILIKILPITIYIHYTHL